MALHSLKLALVSFFKKLHGLLKNWVRLLGTSFRLVLEALLAQIRAFLHLFQGLLKIAVGRAEQVTCLLYLFEGLILLLCASGSLLLSATQLY